VHGWKRAQAVGIRALVVPPHRRKGVRGFGLAERPTADKAAVLSPTVPIGHGKTWWPIGPKPATCRQARSRWRLDDRKVVQRSVRQKKRQRFAFTVPLEVAVGGFSHDDAADSLQKWC
jgi:hypothetical protein